MSDQAVGPSVTLSRQQHEQGDAVEWFAIADAANLSIDARVHELLGITGSLTRRLRELCGEAFRLQLLGERQRQQSRALVREVIMFCGERPWVFAQTVIPQTTLQANPWLSELGNRPLGDTLFHRDNVKRGGLYLAELKPGDRLYERAVRDTGLGQRPASLLARQSLIHLDVSELSINEVFFPAAGRIAAA
ncbi:MAG: chorismate lyase [Gammaproteobacteria bacterium]|nr:chorismate lyase [Gammaproteobacteria bacterium]NNF62239.1 chorismate lyase [Gammaproteobacteria bacterium]NNM21036.1 chorismate lyase [Gammaproteobacteria bacterium]